MKSIVSNYLNNNRTPSLSLEELNNELETVEDSLAHLSIEDDILEDELDTIKADAELVDGVMTSMADSDEVPFDNGNNIVQKLAEECYKNICVRRGISLEAGEALSDKLWKSFYKGLDKKRLNLEAKHEKYEEVVNKLYDKNKLYLSDLSKLKDVEIDQSALRASMNDDDIYAYINYKSTFNTSGIVSDLNSFGSWVKYSNVVRSELDKNINIILNDISNNKEIDMDKYDELLSKIIGSIPNSSEFNDSDNHIYQSELNLKIYTYIPIIKAELGKAKLVDVFDYKNLKEEFNGTLNINDLKNVIKAINDSLDIILTSTAKSNVDAYMSSLQNKVDSFSKNNNASQKSTAKKLVGTAVGAAAGAGAGHLATKGTKLGAFGKIAGGVVGGLIGRNIGSVNQNHKQAVEFLDTLLEMSTTVLLRDFIDYYLEFIRTLLIIINAHIKLIKLNQQ